MDARVLHVARFEFARNFSAKGELVCLLVLVLIASFKLGGEALMDLGRPSAVIVAVEARGDVDISDLSTRRYLFHTSNPSEREEKMADLGEGRLAALLVPSSGAAPGYTVHIADPTTWSDAFKADISPVTFRLSGVVQSVPLPVLEVLRKGPEFSLMVHADGGEVVEPTARVASTVLAVILVLSVISTLNVTVQAFAGEKSGKVCEMVLSALPIAVWLDGKLIAVGLHGLKAAVIFLAYAFAAVWAMGLLEDRHLAQLLDQAFVLSLVLIVCLVGGLFWSCAFAAIAATLSAELSPTRNSLVAIPMTALLLVLSGINEPLNPFMVVLSYLPVTSMFAMPALLVQGHVTFLEFALSLGVLIAACWLLRIAAIRAFRSAALSGVPSRRFLNALNGFWLRRSDRHL